MRKPAAVLKRPGAKQLRKLASCRPAQNKPASCKASTKESCQRPRERSVERTPQNASRPPTAPPAPGLLIRMDDLQDPRHQRRPRCCLCHDPHSGPTLRRRPSEAKVVQQDAVCAEQENNMVSFSEIAWAACCAIHIGHFHLCQLLRICFIGCQQGRAGSAEPASRGWPTSHLPQVQAQDWIIAPECVNCMHPVLRIDSRTELYQPLVASQCTQPLQISQYIHPRATCHVTLSPFGPKSEGQVHHTGKQPCYEALVEVRVALSGREGRDHILSIWEIRHGDPNRIASTPQYYNIELLHPHNHDRLSAPTHLRSDCARLPILPVSLIAIGLCLQVISHIARILQLTLARLRHQARHRSLILAVNNCGAAGRLPQQRRPHRHSRQLPKARRWSSRHFQVSLRHHIQWALRSSAQEWCKLTLQVVVGYLRTLHQTVLAHSNRVLDYPDSDNTCLSRFEQISPIASRWPLPLPTCGSRRLANMCNILTTPLMITSQQNMQPHLRPGAALQCR